MFVLALIRQYTHQPARGEVYLGLAGLAAGICHFIGTDTLYFIYDMQEPYVVQQYMALLVPLFLALYFERNLRLVYPRRSSALVLAACICALLQILLQILDIRRLDEMTSLPAAATAVVCTAEVTLAVSGAQAFKTRPDLILLDYEMPICDGKMTLEMIRADDDMKDIPVVFLTAVNDRANIEAVLRLKPAGYFLKPPVKNQLLAEIEKILHSASAEGM